MIHERYINEANRIRSKFFENLERINMYENEITDLKSKILKEVEKCDEYIKSNKKVNVEQVKVALNENLNEIDLKINKILKIIQPHFDEMDKLKKDSKELFISIKDKYPHMTEEEIQKEVIYSIKK